MKITKTITVDMEVWEEAQNHIDNLSACVNEYLKGLNSRRSKEGQNKELLEIEVKESRNIIRDASIKESLALQALKDLEKDNLIKVKEIAENEQFKRWMCPVCKHLNFMDVERCNKCQLPTRNDTKTVVTSTKEVELK